jgi:hypothetical protein
MNGRIFGLGLMAQDSQREKIPSKRLFSQDCLRQPDKSACDHGRESSNRQDEQNSGPFKKQLSPLMAQCHQHDFKGKAR